VLLRLLQQAFGFFAHIMVTRKRYYKQAQLPSKLHKELQRAGLIVGIDVVYRGARTNDKERRQRLYNLFHGDPNDSNNVSLVDHLYEGTGCFTGLYEDSESERAIKDCLSRVPGYRFVAGKQVTKELLHSSTLKKKDYAGSQTLWNQAAQTLCECKKALAIATVYLATNGGKPPSGHTEIDYYNHLLDKMWLAEQKLPQTERLEEDDEEGDSEADPGENEAGASDVRPENYLFSGFLAFALFGPYVPEGLEANRLLHLFNQSDDEEGKNPKEAKRRKKAVGRASARQEDSDSEATHRNNQRMMDSNASASTERGMGWKSEVQVTQIALQSQFAEAREKDRKITCLHFQINQAQQSVKTDIDLAKAMAPNDMDDELWKDVLDGRKKVKELGAQLVQMQMEQAKPSEKLQFVNDFLRKAVLKRPAPPMTPMTTSPKSRPETPGTQASGASNLTEFWPEPPREVQVPTPTKKAKASEESSSEEGLGLCAAGNLCPMPSLYLGRGCFGPSGKPMHTCTECKGIIHSGLCASGDGYELICKMCDQ
jgi:hypothetical protein